MNSANLRGAQREQPNANQDLRGRQRPERPTVSRKAPRLWTGSPYLSSHDARRAPLVRERPPPWFSRSTVGILTAGLSDGQPLWCDGPAPACPLEGCAVHRSERPQPDAGEAVGGDAPISRRAGLRPPVVVPARDSAEVRNRDIVARPAREIAL